MSADGYVHNRTGDDHLFTWAEHGYSARVENVKRNTHGLYGEVSIETNYALTEGGSPGHLFFDTINLSKNEDKARAVKALIELSNGRAHTIPWERMLEAVRYVVRQEHRRGDAFVRIKDVRAGPMKWLFERVMPLNDPTTFFAAGGTGKSTIVAQAAVAAASGFKCGVFSPAGIACPVLVLDWETTSAEWSRRIDAICRGMGIPTPETIFYQAQSGALVEGIVPIRRKVQDEGIGLVIVDSLMAAYGGAILPEYTTPFFNALRSLPATPAIVHHLSKAQAQDSNGPPDMYGDVTITNRTRAAWALKRNEAVGEDGVMEIVMTNTKMNGASIQRSYGVRLVHTAPDADDYTIHHQQFDPLAAQSISTNLRLGDRVLATLRGLRMTHKEVAETLDVPEITARRTLYRLKERGYVDSNTEGRGPKAETDWGIVQRG